MQLPVLQLLLLPPPPLVCKSAQVMPARPIISVHSPLRSRCYRRQQMAATRMQHFSSRSISSNHVIQRVAECSVQHHVVWLG